MKQLLDIATIHAKAQHHLAALQEEDITHWHHVFLADLLIEMRDRLRDAMVAKAESKS